MLDVKLRMLFKMAREVLLVIGVNTCMFHHFYIYHIENSMCLLFLHIIIKQFLISSLVPLVDSVQLHTSSFGSGTL